MTDEQSRTARHPLGWTDVSLLLMATIWAVNFSAVKYAVQTFGALAFTGLRIGLAAALLWVIARMFPAGRPARRDMLMLLALGALGNGVYQLLFVGGLARIRVATAVLIIASSPALIAIVSSARGIERLRPRAIGGILLSIAGVAMVILDKTGARAGASTTLGVVMIFAAVVCWTVFTVGLQPIAQRVRPIHITAVTMLGGTLPLLLTTPLAIAAVSWRSVGMNTWLALAYSVVLSIIVAYFIWFRAIRIIGPTRTAVFTNLQPAIAILAAWVTLHEVPTIWQGIGTVTIMTGVFLTRS